MMMKKRMFTQEFEAKPTMRIGSKARVFDSPATMRIESKAKEKLSEQNKVFKCQLAHSIENIMPNIHSETRTRSSPKNLHLFIHSYPLLNPRVP